MAAVKGSIRGDGGDDRRAILARRYLKCTDGRPENVARRRRHRRIRRIESKSLRRTLDDPNDQLDKELEVRFVDSE